MSPPGGGPKNAESARETACRETLEEALSRSGVIPQEASVTVGEIAHVFGRQFYLFDCELDFASQERLEASAPFTTTDADTNSQNRIQVFLATPEQIAKRPWRFPDQSSIVLRLLRRHRHSLSERIGLTHRALQIEAQQAPKQK